MEEKHLTDTELEKFIDEYSDIMQALADYDKGVNNMEMLKRIGKPAMLEAMGEESAELAQAALKYARVLRGENPTPVTEEEALKNLIEEYTDVVTCARELSLNVDESIIDKKQKRFLERWHAENKD